MSHRDPRRSETIDEGRKYDRDGEDGDPDQPRAVAIMRIRHCAANECIGEKRERAHSGELAEGGRDRPPPREQRRLSSWAAISTFRAKFLSFNAARSRSKSSVTRSLRSAPFTLRCFLFFLGRLSESSTILAVTFPLPATSTIACHFPGNSSGSSFRKGRIWNSLAGLANPCGSN